MEGKQILQELENAIRKLDSAYTVLDGEARQLHNSRTLPAGHPLFHAIHNLSSIRDDLQSCLKELRRIVE